MYIIMYYVVTKDSLNLVNVIAQVEKGEKKTMMMFLLDIIIAR